jgi:DNA gyrase/topoisomerase IV subunit A
VNGRDDTTSEGIFDDILEEETDKSETDKVEDSYKPKKESPKSAEFSDTTYINFGTFTYHLRRADEEETVCGQSLIGSEFKESSDKPGELLEPCKMCHGGEWGPTGKREQLRKLIANKIDTVVPTESKPGKFSQSELTAISNSIPISIDTDRSNINELRYQLHRAVKGISNGEDSANEFSKSELEAINNALDSIGIIPDRADVIILGDRGTIKRTPLAEFEPQKRGGKGVNHIELNMVEQVASAYTLYPRNFIFPLTTSGDIYQIRAHEIPSKSKGQSGVSASDIIGLDDDERVISLVSSHDITDQQHLLITTSDGYIKRTPTEEFENIHTTGIRAIDNEAKLIEAALAEDDCNIILSAGNGYSIRFLESDIRPMGRSAKGVAGIDLKEDADVVDMSTVEGDTRCQLFTLTKQGFGKRTDLSDYRVQTRNGKGLIDIKTGKRNGSVIDVAVVTENSEIIVFTEQGRAIRIHANDVSCLGRNTRGVNIIDLEQDDAVASSTIINSKQSEND